MFVDGGQETLEPIAPTVPDEARLPMPGQEALLSPSIERVAGERMAAFELKFLIAEALAREVERWAAARMQADAFADPTRGGAYQTTTLYLDTPGQDVLHRSPGHRRRKYRLRRYGQEPHVYLERKMRRGDRVAKQRSHVPLQQLTTLTSTQPADDWPGDWFRARIAARALAPACRITYERTAFVQRGEDGPLRLTLDRQIRGLPSREWDLSPLEQGQGILADQVICELKFRGALPGLFKEMIQLLQLEVGSVSKYRRMMVAVGAAAGEEPRHA